MTDDSEPEKEVEERLDTDKLGKAMTEYDNQTVVTTRGKKLMWTVIHIGATVFTGGLWMIGLVLHYLYGFKKHLEKNNIDITKKVLVEEIEDEESELLSLEGARKMIEGEEIDADNVKETENGFEVETEECYYCHKEFEKANLINVSHVEELDADYICTNCNKRQ